MLGYYTMAQTSFLLFMSVIVAMAVCMAWRVADDELAERLVSCQSSFPRKKLKGIRKKEKRKESAPVNVIKIHEHSHKFSIFKI